MEEGRKDGGNEEELRRGGRTEEKEGRTRGGRTDESS